MFPAGDAQFWIVTLAFVLALLWIGRGLLPGSKARRSKRGRRASLTVRGKAIDRTTQPRP